MLYFAYGMNTDTQGMALRCPGAVSKGAARLVDHCFRFAHHADVVACENHYVDGVLWEIDQQHLNSLDRLEGYPWYYDRQKLPVQYQGQIVQAQCYRMQPGVSDAMPARHYLDCLLRGYAEHGVPTNQIYLSLQAIEKTEDFVSTI